MCLLFYKIKKRFEETFKHDLSDDVKEKIYQLYRKREGKKTVAPNKNEGALNWMFYPMYYLVLASVLVLLGNFLDNESASDNVVSVSLFVDKTKLEVRFD